MLEEHIDLLHGLADLLLEKETVLGKELDEMIHSLKPDIDLPDRSEEDAIPLETVDSSIGDEDIVE